MFYFGCETVQLPEVLMISADLTHLIKRTIRFVDEKAQRCEADIRGQYQSPDTGAGAGRHLDSCA